MGLKILLPWMIACLLAACANSTTAYLSQTPVDVPLKELPKYWLQGKQRFNFSQEEPGLPAKPVKGYVEIRYLIDSNGQPFNPQIVASEPQGELDPSALAALAKIRYRPAKSNPEAIPVYVTNRFDIEINEVGGKQ